VYIDCFVMLDTV